MAVKLVQSFYDEVTNKTKFYLEDSTDDIHNIFQEVTTGDVTNKTNEEQLQIALDVHYARYYADKATNEFLEVLSEKSKKLDVLMDSAGTVLTQVEAQRKLGETSNSSLSELMTLFFNSTILVIDDEGNTAINPIIIKWLNEKESEA